ncbi:pentapeptide repeat-containing protein, partial [Rhodomicrobium udaipurense]
GGADFERTEFLKEKNGPLSHGVKFQRTRFTGKADFRSSLISGSADFSKAQFAAAARFDEARFLSDTMFEGAVFSGSAGFNAAQFLGNAGFAEAQFTGEARFAEAAFKGEVRFDRGQFWNDVSFRDARFDKPASFVDMRAEGKARFPGTKFALDATFTDARFSGEADFSAAEFGAPAVFRQSGFTGGVTFAGARFLSQADFASFSLGKTSTFAESRFEGEAVFREARFEAPVSFASTAFLGKADFSAAQSRVAFVLAGATFRTVPDFLEANFHEPPRLDNMTVADPLKRFHSWKKAGISDPRGPFFKAAKVCKDPDASAKFRRLKKLASEAQDLPREQEFFAQEFRCRRFWSDKPFGSGIGRFWLGYIYGGVANFGRSLLRPAALWLLSVVVFACFYLAARGSAASFLKWPPAAIGSPCASGTSNPILEAIYLSLRSAFLQIDWHDSINARRVFGCLYGVEPGGTPIMPLIVSSLALFQAILSAALIFLFLLALRNLLKVR